ncbi:hypothetical protein O3P69_008909 [Scylla paramamosain]|uniref:Uncharacterized protein n=1 Tax=Scylla paramamosain TaxID=85552 RepID=A0AAW0TPV0_SCYPA
MGPQTTRSRRRRVKPTSAMNESAQVKPSDAQRGTRGSARLSECALTAPGLTLRRAAPGSHCPRAPPLLASDTSPSHSPSLPPYATPTQPPTLPHTPQQQSERWAVEGVSTCESPVSSPVDTGSEDTPLATCHSGGAALIYLRTCCRYLRATVGGDGRGWEGERKGMCMPTSCATLRLSFLLQSLMVSPVLLPTPPGRSSSIQLPARRDPTSPRRSAFDLGNPMILSALRQVPGRGAEEDTPLFPAATGAIECILNYGCGKTVSTWLAGVTWRRPDPDAKLCRPHILRTRLSPPPDNLCSLTVSLSVTRAPDASGKLLDCEMKSVESLDKLWRGAEGGGVPEGVRVPYFSFPT